MSQQQPQRPSEPIKYDDVFNVFGELASEPVAPQDAAILQEAEADVVGNTPIGAPTALVQSAADLNEQRGFVGHDDMTDVVRDHGVTIAEAEVGGYRMVTEPIGGQVESAIDQIRKWEGFPAVHEVIGQYGQTVEDKMADLTIAVESDAVTTGYNPTQLCY